MNVFGLNHRIPIQLPAIAEIPGFRIGVAIPGIYQAANGSRIELGRRSSDLRQRIADAPVLKLNSSAGNNIRVLADGKGGLEYGGVLLLDHEQRDIFEHLAIIDSITAAQQVLAVAGKIKGKPDAWTEILVVVVRKGGGQRIADGLQFQEGAALGNGRASDQVEVLVPAQPQVHAQAVSDLPVILKVETEHLGADDESWIARGG